MSNIIKLPALKEKTGKSRSSLYLMIANGSFPKPIKLGRRSVGWLESEVENWIEKRMSERNGLGGLFNA
jgi:prophage regulatory protein